MDVIRIKGIQPYDGDYEVDFSRFTNRELHKIKVTTGLRTGEYNDALTAGDNDLITALAIVALRRNDVDVNEDIMWDADAGLISMVAGDEEDVPPIQGPNDRQTSSGEDTSPGSDPQATPPSPTGTPDWPTSVTSDLATSAT